MFPYAATIFSGAFLLFLVQPLIAGFVLPWFGGGPGVWTTCLLFFQVLLLGGHWYAHLLARHVPPKAQVLIHLVLLGIALAMLPITPADSWKPTAHADPTLQIIKLLAATVGLPFFSLAATSPLIQYWSSHTNRVRVPYRLYAISNVGSLLALVSYPVLFETQFTRTAQAKLWGFGVVLYTVCCGFCAVRLWRTPRVANRATSKLSTVVHGSAPTFTEKVLCLLLSGCASLLLLATTNKMCQEVAVIPFLWVLPLAIYLLSYIICFDQPHCYKRPPFAGVLILSWGGVCWVLFAGVELPILFQLGAYSVSLFACCMICHGELYRLRPAPRHLTGFYLMIAAGGALGGGFVAVIAPLIFTDYLEWQVGLLLCGALFLFLLNRDRSVVKRVLEGGPQSRHQWWSGKLHSAFALSLVGLAVAFGFHQFQAQQQSVERVRNFYGVLTVQEGRNADLNRRVLSITHGQTLHGLQFMDAPQSAWPTTYYAENSGIGLCLNILPAGQRRIGLIGLGIGTLATYAQAGDYLHFYEINPEVLRLANSRFTYLANCRGKLEVTLGDARLSLEREPAQSFDLLVLDAFNSDAIPVHLLTKEAFAIYGRHLRTNGVIAVHISNKSVNLEPVVAQLARQFNYQFAVIESTQPSGKAWIMGPTWMLLSRNWEMFDSPTLRRAARPVLAKKVSVPLWTDDFASLFQILGRASNVDEDSEFTRSQSEIVFHLHRQNDFAGAIACLRNALKVEPNSPTFLNDLAVVLLSSPDLSLRNIPEAMRYAEKACRLTRYLSPNPVSTLAAIYSEAGRYIEAANIAEKAYVLAAEAGDHAAALNYQELSVWFRSGRSYRESQQLNSTNRVGSPTP